MAPLEEFEILEEQEDTVPPRPLSSFWTVCPALVFSAIANCLATRESELASELICWLLLPVLFSIARRWTTSHEEEPPAVNGVTAPNENERLSSSSLWIVAVALAQCSIYKANLGVVITLFPALTPLLAVALRYLRSGRMFHVPSHKPIMAWIAIDCLGMGLVSDLAIVALWQSGLLTLASILPVVYLFIAYVLLTPQVNTSRACSCFRWVDFTSAVRPLSLRVLIVVAIAFVVKATFSDAFDINPMNTILLGLAKALSWFFTSQLAQSSSWLVASSVGTFGLVASRNPFTERSSRRAFLNVLASLTVLAQTMSFLPKLTRVRLMVCVAALVPLVPYIASLATIRTAESLAVVSIEKHPVEVLMKRANDHFDGLLRNQSKTFEEAEAEYRRRYGFEPPNGFEDWYNFAKLHQSPIIDEFDIISEAMVPFLKLSGMEIREIYSQIFNSPNHQLWSCTIAGHIGRSRCSYRGRGNDEGNAEFFNKINDRLDVELNVSFLLNHLDEPAVLIPPEANASTQPTLTNLANQPAYKTLTKFCSARQDKGKEGHTPPETYGLPFVTDRKSAMDICSHPEYGEMHGLFVAPESLLLTEGPIPVLSNGAPTVFGDILYPSTAYVEEERFRYHETNDVDWDAKQNNLYWAGSTTGGHNSETSWRNLHRQRFVALAQNLQPQGSRMHSYLKEKHGDGNITRVESSFLNSRLYDVAFASILQCDAEACDAQRKYFSSKAWESGDRPYHSRLVFDLDGNGISGRYYKLLASKSAPLKQTLFREWHDDRLMPWVHYIPVSQSMEELPELVFYLTSTPSGQKRAQEIATQGRDWFGQAFREIDVTIYMYRLFLELARLQDPERPAGNGSWGA